MPYRRLPNTDEARLRALNAALIKAENTIPQDLAFSQIVYVKLKRISQQFGQALQNHRVTYKNRVQGNKKYLKALKKAKIYLSHYIQVFNLCVIRNEAPKSAGKYFGIESNKNTVPVMTSEEDVLEWGKKIIEGDKLRIAKGGSPIYNPKIAVVKIEYDNFVNAYHYKKTLCDIHERACLKLDELKKEADEIILEIWNQTEEHFFKNNPEIKRELSEKYGVVYVYRKKEKLQFNL